jgi:hypothetical protein
MAFDTDNNVAVSGFSGEAVIATDYSLTEGNHFQVVKVAYGNTSDNSRVTSSNGLPVQLVNNPTVVVSTITNPVTVTGSVTIGSTLNVSFNLRALTAGDPTTGLAPGADFVRVVGYSGGFPIAVTGSNFAIRSLTAGDPSTGLAPGADFVRIVGYSGGWAVGVTATDLDIRSLTYGSDSVSVLNVVNVQNGGNSPYSTSITDGFQTRLLRASKEADPAVNSATLISRMGSFNTVEDAVRVVGLSGAYPVDAVGIGVTNISDRTTRVPFHVDDTGALYVNLAAGTIGVTATISGSQFILSGISLAGATTTAGVIQVHGYTGPGAILVGVTATDLDIRGLSSATDSVFADIRVLGACGDYVGVTGNVLKQIEKLSFETNGAGGTDLRVFEPSVSGLNSVVSQVSNEATFIRNQLTNVTTNDSMLKVDIKRISQPTGITSGKLVPPISSSAATNMASFVLQSGIHFKSDLGNENVTIYIGSGPGVTAGNGYPLYNGDQIFIETDNSNKIYVSSTAAGATLYYIGT